MRRYPRSVRDAAVKCIPCNAPVLETSGGDFVCVRCGDPRIRKREQRTFHDERDGVRVGKTVEVVDDSEMVLRYAVESRRDDRALVEVVDRFPESFDGDGLDCKVQIEDGQWSLSGAAMAYTRQLAGRQAIETSIHIACEDDVRDAVATRPSVRSLRPGESESTGARGHAPTGATFDVVDAGNPLDGTPAGGSTPAARRPSTARPSEEASAEHEDAPALIAAIPAYNEAETVGAVVEATNPEADVVTVVDDGSDDRTRVRAAGAGANVVEHDRNMGYGAALKTIFREAARRGADYLVVLDADGQHDPADIPKLVDAQRQSGAEIVIGSRFVEGSETELPAYRRLGLLVINFLMNLSMGVVRPRSFVKDTQSGFRLYNSRAIEELAGEEGIGDRMDASVDILLFAHQRNYEIDEVGVTIDYGVENANSYNPVFHGYQLLKNVLRTIERERPILSLGIPGLLLSAGGVGFAVVTFQRYVETGTLPMVVVVLATFGTVVGLSSCFTAIVLHALNTYFSRRV